MYRSLTKVKDLLGISKFFIYVINYGGVHCDPRWLEASGGGREA